MSPLSVIITIAAYFAILFTVSSIAGRKADNAGFFVGNRKSSWYVVDVYKRQFQNMAKEMKMGQFNALEYSVEAMKRSGKTATGGISFFMTESGLEPVSYTHLDVYKRQE